jgi:hypothetical protein
MVTPQSYLAYTPRGAGLMCAVVCVEAEKDVYGWWIGFMEGRFPSAFFRLENFFSSRDTRFFATQGSDIYGGWKFDYSSSRPEITPPIPVAEQMCHELDRMQDVFAAEWLFFEGDQGIEDEMEYYGRNDLPLQEVNIRSKRLNKMDKGDVVWRYLSKDLDLGIIDYMMPRWPLEYGKY